MNVGSLFSGCGGLDLGLHYAGFDLAWACESDPNARAVFSRHWPAVTVAADVREIDAGFPPVDVLAGGFPCQDVSLAGRRAGLVDGNRSGLWFEYARAIRVLRPRVVIVENVAALLTAGFGLVMADLAEAGYDARWCCLRASDLGAPHRRERIFIVATDASDERRDGRVPPLASAVQGQPRNEGEAAPPDAAGQRWRRGSEREDGDALRRETAERLEGDADTADGCRAEWGAYGEAVLRWERIIGRPPLDQLGIEGV